MSLTSFIIDPACAVGKVVYDTTVKVLEAGTHVTSNTTNLRHAAQVAIGTIGACGQLIPGSTSNLGALNNTLEGFRDAISATRFIQDTKELLEGKPFENNIQLGDRAVIPNVIALARSLSYLVVDACATLSFASRLGLVNLGTLAAKAAELPYMQFVRTATLNGAKTTFVVVGTLIDLADIARESVSKGGKITRGMMLRIATDITRLMSVVLFASTGAYVLLAANVAFAASSALYLTKDLLVHYGYLPEEEGKKLKLV